MLFIVVNRIFLRLAELTTDMAVGMHKTTHVRNGDSRSTKEMRFFCGNDVVQESRGVGFYDLDFGMIIISMVLILMVLSQIDSEF